MLLTIQLIINIIFVLTAGPAKVSNAKDYIGEQ